MRQIKSGKISRGEVFPIPGRAGGYPPAPPQTRTSRFPAYGSSSGRQATVATSVGSVNECCRLSVPASSPRRCFHEAVPFPTPRLPRFGSPAFWQYYETAKTTGRISPHSVCHVVPRYLGLISCLRSPSQGNHCVSARVLSDRSHPLLPVFCPKDTFGSPKFPANPCAFALLSD